MHAPLSSRGLNIPGLYTEQGLAYIEMLLMHGHREKDITGKLLQGTLQQTKVKLGLPGPLLLQDYGRYHCLVTNTWIKHAWMFLWEHGLSMEDPGPHLERQREGDRHLIPSFYSAGIRGKQLAQLNWCRLYLQVTTLADITTGSGDSITTCAWKGIYNISEEP